MILPVPAIPATWLYPDPKDAAAFGKIPQHLIDRARIADRSKQPPPPTYNPPPPPPDEGWSTGTKVAVGVAAAAVVGSMGYLLARAGD